MIERESRLRLGEYYARTLARLSEAYASGRAREALGELREHWPHLRECLAWTGERMDDRDVREIFLSMCAAAELVSAGLGRRDQARWFHTWIDACRAEGDRRGEAEAHRFAGSVVREMDLAASRRHYDTALTIAREIGDRSAECSAESLLGIYFAARGETEEAVERMETAVTIARQRGDRARECAILANIGTALRTTRPRTSLEYQQRAHDAAAASGHALVQANALMTSGSIHLMLGELRLAMDCLERSLRLYADLGDTHGEIVARNNLAEVLLALGLSASGEAYVVRALAAAQASEHRRLEGALCCTLAHALRSTLRPDAALAAAARGRAIADETGDRCLGASADRELGAATRYISGPDAARPLLERALQSAEARADQHERARVLLYLGEVEASQAGDIPPPSLVRALEEASEHGFRYLACQARSLLARWHAAHGRATEASRHGRHALVFLREVEHADLRDQILWLRGVRQRATREGSRGHTPGPLA